VPRAWPSLIAPISTREPGRVTRARAETREKFHRTRGRSVTRATSRSRKSNKVKERGGGGKVETRTDISKGEAARGLNLNRRQGLAVLKLRFSCRRRVLIFPRVRNFARSLDVPSRLETLVQTSPCTSKRMNKVSAVEWSRGSMSEASLSLGSWNSVYLWKSRSTHLPAHHFS